MLVVLLLYTICDNSIYHAIMCKARKIRHYSRRGLKKKRKKVFIPDNIADT